jgi:hypothetical protein
MLIVKQTDVFDMFCLTFNILNPGFFDSTLNKIDVLFIF